MSDEFRSLVVEERVMSTVDPRPPPQQPPSYQQYPQLPQSTIQLAHATTEAVVGGLGKSPYLLGVVVLNVIGIVAAVYFLNLLISGQQQHLKSLVEVQQGQLDKIIVMHQKEFDALLEMGNRLSTIPSQSPIAPGSQILTQPPVAPPRGRTP